MEGELGATMVFLLTGVLVARLTAEMLLARSVRVFQARRLVSYGLCLALTGGALLAVDGDILGLETRIPAPEQISQATLSVGCTQPARRCRILRSCGRLRSFIGWCWSTKTDRRGKPAGRIFLTV